MGRPALQQAVEIPNPMNHSILDPIKLGGLTLRNRVIKSATYEGMTPDGVPSPRLVAHHRALAAGGVGMTTVAYCAVHLRHTAHGVRVLDSDIVLAVRITNSGALEQVPEVRRAGLLPRVWTQGVQPRVESRVRTSKGLGR